MLICEDHSSTLQLFQLCPLLVTVASLIIWWTETVAKLGLVRYVLTRDLAKAQLK